jgi:3-dehydroquinate synthase II
MQENTGRIWFKINHYDKELVTTAIEAGIDTFLTSPEVAEKIRKLARVKIAGVGGDLIPEKDFHIVAISSKEEEKLAVSLGQSKPVIITTLDWEIIPIENLIAANARVFWTIPSFEKARLAFSILEKGVSGVVLETNDIREIKKFSALINQGELAMQLDICQIEKIESVGMGDRICVDTASSMNPNQGMLAGNSSGGMLLVQSESTENPYVAPRPFRVNLSAVHAYTLLPNGKTSYLSELKAGLQVMILDRAGNTEVALVGRIKMEKRPMVLVTFRKLEFEYNTEPAPSAEAHTLLLQNAETVRVFHSEQGSISVAELKPGDKVLAYFEKTGRHFGMKIEESIQEK